MDGLDQISEKSYGVIADDIDLTRLGEGLVNTASPMGYQSIGENVEAKYAHAEGLAHLSWADSMDMAWRYDSTVTAAYNYFSKPNKFDAAFLASDAKTKALAMMEQQYGKLAKPMMDTFTNEVNSAEDLAWFQETVNHKKVADQAWEDHWSAALVGAGVLDPMSIAGVMSGNAVLASASASTKLAKLYRYLGKATPKQQAAIYAGYSALVGGAQAVPGVAWNYDDPIAIPVGMAAGGLFGIGGALGFSPLEILSKLSSEPSSRKSLEKTSGKSGVYNRMSAFMSTADELDGLQDGLGAKLLGSPHKGIKQDVDSAASRAHALSSKLQIHLQQLEQDLVRDTDFFNKSLSENIAMAMGKQTRATYVPDDPKQTKEWVFQRVKGVLGNIYHIERVLKLREDTQRALDEELVKLRTELGIDDDLASTDLDILADEVNRLRQMKYARDLELHKSYDPTKGVTMTQEPKVPDVFEVDPECFRVITEPDLTSEPEIVQKIVEDYRKSGLGKALGEMVNNEGNGLREVMVSDNYFHTKFSLNKIDKKAEEIAVARRDSDMARVQELNAIDRGLRDLIQNANEEIKNLKGRAEYVVKHPNKRPSKMTKSSYQAVDDINKLTQDARDAQKEITKHDAERNEIFSKTRSNYLEAAYSDLLGIIGQQMTDSINHSLARKAGDDKAFRQYDPKPVGAILVASLVGKTGHRALKQALDSVRQDLSDDLLQAVYIASGDLHIPLTVATDLGIGELISQIAPAHRYDGGKAIGEASAFKSRFGYDYMHKYSVLGTGNTALEDSNMTIELFELLDDDILNTAMRNIQEESGRVALSHISIPDPMHKGKFIQLNEGASINAAQDIITDIAKRQGYDEKSASDLAEFTFDVLLGRQMGETLSPTMQALTQIAQMVQLKNSGIFNLVDIVNVAHEFGTVATVKAMIPALKMGLKTSTLVNSDAESLKTIVSKMYAMEGRRRPDVGILNEDMSEVSTKSAVFKGIMNCSQYNRWINLQQPVAQWQANMCTAMYEEGLEALLKKDAKNVDDFSKYLPTVTADELKVIKEQYAKHGLNTDDWTEYSLARKVERSCFDVVTNTALQVRRGDRPRFLSTEWGKICFAYQSFVWAAHNKLLRRYYNEGGAFHAAFFVVKQLPLAILAAVSVETLKGNDPLNSPDTLVQSVISSMSALGLFGWVGSLLPRGELGGTAPGLGVASTFYQGGRDLVTKGDPIKLLENIPLLGSFLPYRIALAAMGAAIE